MKKLRKIICIMLVLSVVLSDCMVSFASVKKQTVKISGKQDYTMAYNVLKLVNKERKKKGLPSLKMEKSLLNTAMKRAAECSVDFSHTRPDGSMCFALNEKMIAENIAVGQSDAASVMNSWMNSEGHAQNILSVGAKSIGIGCFFHNGIYYWVQNFGYTSVSKNCSKPANKTTTQKISFIADSGKYKFYIDLPATTLKKNKSVKATLMLINPGFSYARTKINNTVIDWKSSNSKVASVNSSGTVKGKKKGKVTITAKLKYFTVKKKLTVK